MMAMDLDTLEHATVPGKRRVPILVFMGTFSTDDPDKYVTTIWGFLIFVLLEYRMVVCHENRESYA